MNLLIAAVVLAQTTVTVGVGGKAKETDSAAAVRREAMEVARQKIDSVRVKSRNDSSDINCPSQIINGG